MLIRIPDFLTYIFLIQRTTPAYSWQRNMFPVSVMVEEVPMHLIEACETWIQANEGIMQVNPSKLGDTAERDLVLMAPYKAFMSPEVGQFELRDFLTQIRDVLTGICPHEVVLNCGGKSLRVGRVPRLMGILNVTPDSFSDGGAHFREEDAVQRALEMVEEGADILDVGGESSRPGSDPVDAREEMERVIPVIRRLSKEVDVPISIDTTKSEVAQAALDAGAGMINDISGLHWDKKLAELAASYEVPVVIMHTRGKPKTMQQDIHYRSLLSEVIRYLQEGIEVAKGAGVPEDQIVVDPGIGFGKRLEDNLLLMNHLYEFSVLGKPILLGASRKSFIGQVLDAEVDDRLEGTLATTLYGALQGADIIRVHDVKENRRVLKMLETMVMPSEARGEVSK